MNVSVTDAKAQLTDLVRKAEAGEEVVLTRHGRPAVRLLPVRGEDHRADRRLRLLELSAKIARDKSPGPEAPHSTDFLYDDKGMPG